MKKLLMSLLLIYSVCFFGFSEKVTQEYEIQETNSSVICNLKKNSKVLIQRIGKKEKIDGFEDNWVQVEVQQESNGVTDEDFVIGTVGWCYGGYLKESKSVDNTDIKKKKK